MLIEWEDTMLGFNPGVEVMDRARPIAGRIQILARPAELGDGVPLRQSGPHPGPSTAPFDS